MKTLKFDQEIPINTILENHKFEVYESVLLAIKEYLQSPRKKEVKIINIIVKDMEYSINLNRNKFERSLDRACSFYESIEEYEKCQTCIDLKNALSKK